MITSQFQQRIVLRIAGLLILLVSIGCGPDAATKIKESFARMKTVTAEYEALLEKVTDLESAKATLPKLEAMHEKLVAAIADLDAADKTTSRAAISIKNQVKEFKADQRGRMRATLERIMEIEGAGELLRETIEKSFGKLIDDGEMTAQPASLPGMLPK